MPSSTKTEHLSLNKWLGADKPKKDDFNGDNQKIDAAVGTLQQAKNQVESALSNHQANAAAHITAAERALWNSKDQCIVGSYQGNGSASRKITTSFRPRFGAVFAVGAHMMVPDWDVFNLNVYGTLFSGTGGGSGVAVDSTGFTVTHHTMNRPSGITTRLNDASYTYIYVVWP